jgi:hypothetical protein
MTELYCLVYVKYKYSYIRLIHLSEMIRSAESKGSIAAIFSAEVTRNTDIHLFIRGTSVQPTKIYIAFRPPQKQHISSD